MPTISSDELFGNEYIPTKNKKVISTEELFGSQEKSISPTDLLPKFSPTAKIEDQTTITPTDIMAGTMPLKGVRAISTGLSDMIKNVYNTKDISNEPIMKDTGILPKNPVELGAKFGATTGRRQAVETGIDMATQPETYLGLDIAKPGLIRKPLQGLETKLGKVAEPLQGIGNLTRGGVSKEEATRIAQEYGNSSAGLVDTIKSKLSSKLEEANTVYRNAVSGFKSNTIKADKLYQTIQRNLREKGWIDLGGSPTTRYKSGLDPVMDKLTNMYIDMQTPGVSGKVISKADFSTYRDALNAMLKDRPSDIVIMKTKNSLHDIAEEAGMKGIKNARDLEKTAYQMESKFLNRNTGDLKVATENKLSTIGTEKQLSKQELDHIKELEEYIGHPITKDATTINKINRAIARGKSIKDIAKNAILTGGILEGGRKILTGKF